jgi:arylsulfatase A-like enzyme
MRLLVISADGLHPGYVGCYGNDWIATPTLDRLAAEGVVFDRHYADRPDTVGSRRSWRTGRYAFLDEQAPTDLPRDLARHGIETCLIASRQREPPDFVASWQQVHHADHADDEAPLVTHALDALAKKDHSLLWLNSGNLHPPWSLPETYRDFYFEEDEEGADGESETGPWTGPLPERVASNDDSTFFRLQRTFAAAVTGLDDSLGRIVEHLAQRNLLDKTAVIVTSGHGISLGEHGHVGWTPTSLHEETVHLPLIIRMPGAAEAGRRVAALTQSLDLAPTILDCFGVPLPDFGGRLDPSASPAAHGFSLWPLCKGERTSSRSHVFSALPREEDIWWRVQGENRALLLIDPRNSEKSHRRALYIKPEDRWEVNDVAQHFPADVADLESVLQHIGRADQ